MKKILGFVLLLIVFMSNTTPLQAQTNSVIYDDHVQVRNVPYFTSIKVSSAIDLYLSQSNETKVAVSASNDEIRDHIITEVQGGTLIIKLGENGSWFDWKKWGNYKTKAYVSVKDLYSIIASGASDIHLVNILEQPKLKLSLTGASDVKGEMNVGALFLECTGASNVELKGRADDAVVRMTGASDAKLYNLQLKAADVSATGACHIRISVSEVLKVSATGASDVDYRGNPVTKNISTSGASNVRRRD
jgi:hypothetical protein